jgi:hypothetical protein
MLRTTLREPVMPAILRRSSALQRVANVLVVMQVTSAAPPIATRHWAVRPSSRPSNDLPFSGEHPPERSEEG